MSRLTLPTRRQILDAIPRIWWGMLLALHLPILVAVGTAFVDEGFSVSRFGSAAALVLAIVFFVLKLIDCRFLRLRTQRQSFVAVCLLTAIVHGGAIAPTVDDPSRLPTTAVLASTAAVGMAAGVLIALGRRVLRGIELLLALLATKAKRPSSSMTRVDIGLDEVIHRLVRSSIRIPRAPPV